MTTGRVGVVIVVRDHYSSTRRTVQAVIATVDPSVSITLVPGATPSKMISQLHALAPGRLRLIGPRHHLIPNAARQLALEQASAAYVAFVDNGWFPNLAGLRRWCAPQPTTTPLPPGP